MKSKSWYSPGQLVPLVSQVCRREVRQQRKASTGPSTQTAIHPNAFIERFIRSIKEECLNRVIRLGEAHLRELIREYIAHYQVERPHQGLGGAFVQPSNNHAAEGPLVKRERLGGLLHYYYRETA